MRILDESLRKRVGKVEDIEAPVEQIAELQMPVDTVYIVENQQTGLAFTDLPGSIVFIKLGYAVSLLAEIPWARQTDCVLGRFGHRRLCDIEGSKKLSTQCAVATDGRAHIA